MKGEPPHCPLCIYGFALNCFKVTCLFTAQGHQLQLEEGMLTQDSPDPQSGVNMLSMYLT